MVGRSGRVGGFTGISVAVELVVGVFVVWGLSVGFSMPVMACWTSSSNSSKQKCFESRPLFNLKVTK